MIIGFIFTLQVRTLSVKNIPHMLFHSDLKLTTYLLMPPGKIIFKSYEYLLFHFELLCFSCLPFAKCYATGASCSLYGENFTVFIYTYFVVTGKSQKSTFSTNSSISGLSKIQK